MAFLTTAGFLTAGFLRAGLASGCLGRRAGFFLGITAAAAAAMKFGFRIDSGLEGMSGRV